MLRTAKKHCSFDGVHSDDDRICASSAEHSSELGRDKMRSMSIDRNQNFRSASKVRSNSSSNVSAGLNKKDRSQRSVDFPGALVWSEVPFKVTGPSIDFKRRRSDAGIASKKGYAIAPRIINKQRYKKRSSELLVPDVDLKAGQCDALSAADDALVVSPYQEENTSLRKLIDTKKQTNRASQVRILFRYTIDRLHSRFVPFPILCFFALVVIVAYLGYYNASTLNPIMIGMEYETEAVTSKMLLLKEQMDKTQQIVQSLKDEVSDLYDLNEELTMKAETENRNQPNLRGTM